MQNLCECQVKFLGVVTLNIRLVTMTLEATGQFQFRYFDTCKVISILGKFCIHTHMMELIFNHVLLMNLRVFYYFSFYVYFIWQKKEKKMNNSNS